MKNIVFLLIISVLFIRCSGSIDTTELSAEDHFKYAMELFEDDDLETAVNEFQSILLQYPGSPVNDDAQYFLGFTYYKREQFLLSAYEFSKLIRDIPTSEFVPDAQYMLAESYYELSPPYQLEQSYTKKAIEEYQAFIEFFPANAKVAEAETKITEMTKKLAEKEYENAYIYERLDYTNAAIEYYNSVFQKYHDTEFAPDALYKKIMLLIEKERVPEALNDIAVFVERYPENDSVNELNDLRSSLIE